MEMERPIGFMTIHVFHLVGVFPSRLRDWKEGKLSDDVETSEV